MIITKATTRKSDPAQLGRVELRIERQRRLAHRLYNGATRGRRLAVALEEGL